MKIEPKHILLFIAVALLLINRFFQKKDFIQKYGNYIRIIVFLLLIGALLMEFVRSRSYMIFFVAALGLLAIGWIIYDMNRKGKDNDTDSETEQKQ